MAQFVSMVSLPSQIPTDGFVTSFVNPALCLLACIVRFILGGANSVAEFAIRRASTLADLADLADIVSDDGCMGV